MGTETKADRQAWLDLLKVGDEIAYKGAGVYSAWHIRKVTRRTPTGRIVTESYTFEKDGRCRGGDGYSPYECVPVNDSIRRLMSRSALVDKLRNLSFERYSLESLEAIYAEVCRNKLRS